MEIEIQPTTGGKISEIEYVLDSGIHIEDELQVPLYYKWKEIMVESKLNALKYTS